MILTRKTEVDFIKWASYNYGEDRGDLEMMREVYRNALIIEFFDSVGIYIEINVNQITDKNKNIPKCNFDSAIFHVKHRTKEGRTLTQLGVNAPRQQATIQAIKKANDIYNENNSM